MSTREIKFRGREIKSGDFVYGDLLHKHGKTYIAVNYYTKVRVKPCTVKQFIGLDSNGAEIYEDDVVDVVNPNGRKLLPIHCFLNPTMVDLFLSQPGYTVTLSS